MFEDGVSLLNRRLSRREGKTVLGLVLLGTVALPIGFRCLGQSQATGGTVTHGELPGPRPAASPSRIALGKAIFFDPMLSEPAGTSCASCHAPEWAYASDNSSTTGLARGSRPGHFASRSTPSLLYLRYVPRFHYYEDDEAVQPSPYGGFFWDGRADSIAEVVKFPLLNPDEMNNRDASQVARKIASARYAADFRREFGDVLGDPQAVLDAVGRAVEAFLTTDEMAPFSSKFDMYVRGHAKLTPLEARGLKLFKDPDKGNCVSCHLFYDSSSNPARSMFTDYGYDAVGAPRNMDFPGNADPQHFDLGLCARKNERTPSSDEIWCANFRTPSLRNVAVRQSYMHNGVFKTLREAVEFYATRATDPMHWYHSGVQFEDVPPKFRDHVNVNSIPYNRPKGDLPALNDADIDAIVAFLRTLTDAPYRRLAR